MSTSQQDQPTRRQRFELRVDGHNHVACTSGRLTTLVELWCDDALVLSGKAVDTRERLHPETDDSPVRGLVVVRTRTGRVRRVTLELAGRVVDMEPEAGSPAALRLAKERRHPWLFAALDVLLAVAAVLLPLLGIGALVKLLLAPLVAWLLGLLPSIALPSIPWLSIAWPSIPWPNIPWPSIDLSWIPDWQLPGWLLWALDHLDQAKPVLFTLALAVYEVRRRRRQDAEKQRLAQQERDELNARLASGLHQLAARRA
ncbi:hypothetical protein [Luteococcus sp. OSA5]|uniref:hypothetical protein n=1 Tax=Luteococcus sp. OSA5 TaxID=3401630 RepID=UPI003B43AA9D